MQKTGKRFSDIARNMKMETFHCASTKVVDESEKERTDALRSEWK